MTSLPRMISCITCAHRILYSSAIRISGRFAEVDMAEVKAIVSSNLVLDLSDEMTTVLVFCLTRALEDADQKRDCKVFELAHNLFHMIELDTGVSH